MRDTSNRISRRQILRAAGAGVAASGITGFASAGPSDLVEVNVGYKNKSGMQAASVRSSNTVQSFSFDAVTLELPKGEIGALRKNSEIRYVELNGQMHALAQSLPWGVDRIDADIAHENGYTGSGADVAVIDTGIDSDHPDLGDNVGDGTSYADCGTGGYFGCAFYGNDNACNEPWDDDNDHGTHVAGTIGALDNNRGVVGVGTEPTLHAVKVLDCAGSGSFSNVAKGIEYTADQGWDVANMSLGGNASGVVKDAVEYAANNGVLLVAAAGNSGSCSDCVGYPAAYPECVAVSATNNNDGLASFSSTGPEVELAAPGADIESTVPGGLSSLSGTSMASPHVAGAGAQLMSEGYTASEARDQLASTAEDIGLSENESGNGLVDVAAALGLNS